MKVLLFAWQMCLVILLFSLPANSFGQVEVIWETPNDSTVLIDPDNPTTFLAEGSVSGFFDSMLVFDNSGSMVSNTGQTAPNGGSRRADWAISGAEALINGLDDRIRMGLTEFGLGSSLRTMVKALGPIGANPSHRVDLINEVNSLPFDEGGTNVQLGIDFAAEQLFFLDDVNSKHIVLVSDGRENSGSNARLAAQNAIDMGIESINTIGLPGADLGLLQDVADIGNGVFVDGTNLGDLIDGFSSILDSIETVETLELMLPDGTVISDFETDLDGFFSIEGQVFVGENKFIAKATSNFGNVTTAELTVFGQSAVPEPGSITVVFCLATISLLRRRRN